MFDNAAGTIAQESQNTAHLSVYQIRRRAWIDKESQLKSDLSHQPGSPRILMELGRLYSQMDKPKAARECFDLVTTIKPGYQNVDVELLIVDMANMLREETRSKVSDTIGEMPVPCTLESSDSMTRLMIRYLARAQKAYTPWSSDYHDAYADVVGNIAVHRLGHAVSMQLALQLLKYVASDCRLQSHLSMQNIPNVIEAKKRGEVLVEGLPEEFWAENPLWDGMHTEPLNETAHRVVYDPMQEEGIDD